MKIKVYLLPFLFVFCANVVAQEVNKVYRTREGNLNATVYSDSGTVNFSSGKVISVIENQRAEITIRIKVSDLHADVDSMEKKLNNSFFNDIVFRGNLNIDFVNLEDHFDQTMQIDGELTIGEISQHIEFAGVLKYWPTGPDVQKMLYIHYDLDLKEFELQHYFPGSPEIACIEILQPVLMNISNN